MSSDEAYMLPRDSEESKRLNVQHEYFRNLSSGHLIHPSIPSKNLQKVADVATGTGIWLEEVAASPAFSSQSDGQKTKFIGFDISPQQFPSTQGSRSEMEFVVHDITEPFPVSYHDEFDLVNVRLLSFAIKTVDLEKIVRHILQVLRPGGYLQWQEFDPGDCWIIPATPIATAMMNYTLSERIARGLLPGIVTPLVKTIQSFSIQIPEGQINPISWSPDLMRILHLETVSTLNHPSPLAAAGKKKYLTSAGTAIYNSGISRRKAKLAEPSTSNFEAEKLIEEINSLTGWVEQINRGEIDFDWDFEITWIVARKAIVMDEKESWMPIKYPS